VAELKAEVEAYQQGYAPQAQGAGWWEEARLWMGRHRAATVAAAVVVVVTVLYLAQLARSERRAVGALQTAEEHLRALRGTAPVMAAQAESLMGAQDLAGAARLLENVVQLVPEEVGYGRRQGDVWQTLGRWSAAEAAYRRVLALAPDDPHARTNLSLTRELSTLPELSQLQFQQAALLAQGRRHEADFVAVRLATMVTRLEAGWRQRLFEAGVLNPSVNTGAVVNVFRTYADGTASLRIATPIPEDAAAITAIPLSEFELWPPVGRADLEMVRPMPLRQLIWRCGGITTLEPLRGKPLVRLEVPGASVTDMLPLAGAPLQMLDVSGTRVDDLSPLSDMKLEQLNCANTRVRNLTALAGMKLRQLDLRGTAVRDFSPLAEMPLEALHTGPTHAPPLAMLQAKPLRQLSLGGSVAPDLRALAGLPLEILDLSGCAAAVELAPLRGFSRLREFSPPARARDWEVLREVSTLRGVRVGKRLQPVAEFLATRTEVRR